MDTCIHTCIAQILKMSHNKFRCRARCLISPQVYIAMKLTIVLFFASMMTCLGNLHAQRVSLNYNGAQLKKVLVEISKQSGYTFIYNEAELNKSRSVTIQISNKPVMECLEVLFKHQPLLYKVKGKSIAIRPMIKDKDIIEMETTALQQKIIKGRVTDQKYQPIPGVSVQIKGMAQGTVTNTDGTYTITVPSDNNTLVFNYVGFAKQEIAVLNRTEINVVLLEQNNALEEIVVVGYGTQKKSDLTGSIGTLAGNKVAERNVTQTSLALQGSVPGLTASRTNGAPGTSSTLRIRGVTSIGDSDPLILIDGVPSSSIDNVHPADIENISVLKDASAASIYGSKAAAGVILVTTKKGITGKTEFDFAYNAGIERPSNLPEYANVIRYMEMVNEMQWNDTNNPAGGQHAVYSQDLIDTYMAKNAENPDEYPNTDWQDMLLKSQAFRQNYLLNIAGGTDKVRTRASLGYDKMGGLYIGKAYTRLTARLNNDININSKLKSSVNTYFKRSLIENPSESPMTNVYRSAPIYAAVWSNGLIAEGKSGNNMYAQILKGGYNNSWSNQLGARASLDFQPVKNLTISAVVAPVMNFDKGKEFRKKVEYTDYDNPNVYVGTTAWGLTNSLNESRVENYNITSQLLLNYNKSFGKHNLSGLGGFEHYYLKQESLGASSDNLALDSYPYLNLGNPNFLKSSGNAFEYASSSFFGRFNYNYDRRYLFQANVRFDGSSRFHKDYRWGTFPSFSAGWVASEEDFFPKESAVSFLKFRGSYGVLGNERIGNYPYQATIDFATALLYQGDNIAALQSAAQQSYAIKSISWETTTSYNFGFDLGLLKNKLNLNFDVYKKQTKDMLLTLEIPGFMGYGSPDQNAGRMHANGWELAAQWNDEAGDFRYGLSLNIADAKSVIDDLSGVQFLGDQAKIAGSEFNAWYGYRSLGLFQTAAEVAQSPVLNTGLAPGDIRYQDLSGPDGVPDGKISEYDKVVLDGSLPRYTYGGNIDLGYKNFDFSLTFQGVAKQNAYLTANMVQPYQGAWGNMPLEIDGKYWSAYKSPEQNLTATYPRLSNKFITNNYATSDFWLFNGSYFRLKNVVLGYSLPEKLSKKISLRGARIYASAQDILSINKYPKGWDPELGNTSYPITSSVNLGISVKF